MGDTTAVLKYQKEKYKEDRKRLLLEVQQPQTKPVKHTSLTIEKQTEEIHKLFEDCSR